MLASRRGFIEGLGALVCAPTIARVSNPMTVKETAIKGEASPDKAMKTSGEVRMAQGIWGGYGGDPNKRVNIDKGVVEKLGIDGVWR